MLHARLQRLQMAMALDSTALVEAEDANMKPMTRRSVQEPRPTTVESRVSLLQLTCLHDANKCTCCFTAENAVLELSASSAPTRPWRSTPDEATVSAISSRVKSPVSTLAAPEPRRPHPLSIDSTPATAVTVIDIQPAAVIVQQQQQKQQQPAQVSVNLPGVPPT